MLLFLVSWGFAFTSRSISFPPISPTSSDRSPLSSEPLKLHQHRGTQLLTAPMCNNEAGRAIEAVEGEGYISCGSACAVQRQASTHRQPNWDKSKRNHSGHHWLFLSQVSVRSTRCLSNSSNQTDTENKIWSYNPLSTYLETNIRFDCYRRPTRSNYLCSFESFAILLS